jgi:16S rRNA (cytosine1402-N4)-methyltransferase
MPEFVHISVLADEVIDLINPRTGGVYVDGTLGGGGHTRRILDHPASVQRVIGIDRDPNALAAAREHCADHEDRLTTVEGRFADVASILEELGVPQVDGMLLDLGPSSPQFDHAERGFSFQQEGPIDMRMSAGSGETALDLIKRSSPEELATILKELGEERYAKRIAHRMKEAVREGRLQSTLDLAQLCERAIPAANKRKMKIHPATRTFQALRIAVNDELGQLDQFLEVFPDLLAPGGRCVIISFHSLEDRRVKRRFRDLAWSSSLPPDLARQAGERVHPIVRVITRKPVFASDEETARNPRARSARVRACERLADDGTAIEPNNRRGSA